MIFSKAQQKKAIGSFIGPEMDSLAQGWSKITPDKKSSKKGAFKDKMMREEAKRRNAP